MKRYLSIIILAIAAILFYLPGDAPAQTGGRRTVDHGRYNTPVGSRQGNRERGSRNGRHRYRGRNRTTYGYRNYGQYRRTQIGNRRYDIGDYWKKRHVTPNTSRRRY